MSIEIKIRGVIKKHLGFNPILWKMTREEVRNIFMPFFDPEIKEGVYFLYEGDNLVYIGRSSNLIKRIKSHISRNRFHWDKVKSVVTPDKRLSVDIEHAILMNFPTPNNVKPRVSLKISDLYKTHRSNWKTTVKMYDMMLEPYHSEGQVRMFGPIRSKNQLAIKFLSVKDQEEVDRINKNHVISLNNLRMGLEEFKEEYRKKTIGEPHTLTYH